MLKKSALFASILLLSQLTQAETCPLPAELKSHNLSGWQALNINSGNPLSADQLTQFENQVDKFALAEWMDGAPEGSGHCYYFGAQPNPNYLGVFLAKPHLVPSTDATSWRKVGRDDMQCNSGITACDFRLE